MQEITEEKLKSFINCSNRIEGIDSEEADKEARKAWDYLYENIITKEKKLDLKFLLEAHRILLEKQDDNLAGKLRTYDVWVGGDHRPFISSRVLISQLNEFFKRFNGLSRSVDVSDNASIDAHVEFEKIHPFGDGNGRIGRMLYNLQRIQSGQKFHIIHTGREQEEYYKWFE